MFASNHLTRETSAQGVSLCAINYGVRSPAISIIIPVYNEAENLCAVLDQIHALGLKDYEIVVVDDGSKDESAAMAVARGARIVRHPYNIGNGAAVKTGLRHARGKWIVMLDADGQHPPQAIPQLLEHLDRYHMVVAARVRSTEASWHRMFANRFYSWFASYVSQFKVEDLTSGFRAMHRWVALKFLDLLPNTFSYPTTLTLACCVPGWRSSTSRSSSPAKGHSKIRLWEDGTRFLLIISRWRRCSRLPRLPAGERLFFISAASTTPTFPSPRTASPTWPPCCSAPA
jgi:glycosyltransferase involved in cell wall biosynthesis